MIFFCAYSDLRPETRTALLACCREHELRFAHVGDDDYAYGRCLERLWEGGRDFAVVEQDIVIRPDVVDAFTACPEPYCCFPYSWSTEVGPALGCTRFRSELLAAHPEAMREAVATPSAYGQPGHWRQLDVYLMRRILRDRHRLQPHVHLPPVEHLNEQRVLLPGADPTPVMEVRGFA